MLINSHNGIGFSVGDTTAIKTEIQQIYLDALPTLSVEDATPQGMFINISVANKIEQLELFSFAIANYSVNSAKGIFLDTLYSNDDISRIENTFSYATVRFFGKPSSVILAGSIVKSVKGDEFATQEQAIITASGSVDVFVKSTVVGAVEVNANTITTIQSAIPNVTNCDNPTAGVQGTIRETDALFRRRAGKVLYRNSSSSVKNVASRVLGVAGVANCKVVQNQTGADIVIDSKTLVPHSIYAVVDGGDNAEVALALQSSKSLGCQYNGSTEVILTLEGVQYAVYFDRPTPIAMSVKIVLDSTQTVTISTEQIQALILEYFTTQITLGDDVAPSDITGYLYENLSGIRIASLQAGKLNSPFSFTPTILAFYELATITVSAIIIEA